jgi:hypothetical protein
LEDTNVDELEVALYQSIDPRVVEVDLEAECPLPENVIAQMKYEIFNLGRFVMSVPQDKLNDGNNSTVTPEPKQQSDGNQ